MARSNAVAAESNWPRANAPRPARYKSGAGWAAADAAQERSTTSAHRLFMPQGLDGFNAKCSANR